MAISSGDVSTYSALQPVTTTIYILDIESDTRLVFLGFVPNVQPLVSLAQAKDHPLSAPGVGIVNFQPNAEGGGGLSPRPATGVLWPRK